MKKIAIKFSCIAVISMLASACAFSEDALFPSLMGTESQEEIAAAKTTPVQEASLPMLGTTDFKPIEISKVSKTGTFVGQKVAAFRGELTQLQKSVGANNKELQQLRTNVINNAVEYHKYVGALRTRLQIGTTPGNPEMVAALQSAQTNVQSMSTYTVALNQLANRVSTDAATAGYLLSSVRSAFSVSGAVDEDHRQLRMLENETNQIGVLINSLLSEVNSDAARQRMYVDTANNNLLVLDGYIRQGHYGVSTTPASMTFQPLSTPTFSTSANPDTATLTAVPTGKALFTARFSNPNINYKDGLKKAIEAAISKKADVIFTIVAVSPIGGSSASAGDYATKVFQDMTSMGVGADKISISAKSDGNITAPEIQVHVR